MKTYRFAIEEVKRLVRANNKGKGFNLGVVHDNGVYIMAKGQIGIIIHAFGYKEWQGGDDWHIGFDIPADFCDYILQQSRDVKITMKARSADLGFYKTAKKGDVS